MSRDQLASAADSLVDLLERGTPGPWSFGKPGWGGVIGSGPHPERGVDYRNEPDHLASYGGYLICESAIYEDRRLIIASRNAAEHLADLLLAVAAEDPVAVGEHARKIAAAVIAAGTPCQQGETE